jgi:hypothetical protein
MIDTKPSLRGVLAITALALASFAIAGSQVRAQAPGPTPTAEKALQQADPVVYAAARQYFPSDQPGAPSKRIFRLTHDQLDATVRSLLPGYVAQSVKEAMPRDSLQMNYEYAEILNLNSANIGGLSGWIGGIAARVREKPAGVIDCAASKNAPDCLMQQARAFVLKAFRGDANSDKIDKVAAFYLSSVQSAGIAQATGDLVEVVLNSPNFLFRKELDVNPSHRLAPAQLLQAVTYTIADAPPEALNLSSQKAGDYLRTGAEASTTISSIVQSKPARDKLQRFMTAWLEIKEPADFTISPQVFPEFNPKMAAAMRDETQRFLRAQLSKDAPTLKDITQSTQSFVSKTVASLYGGKVDAPSDATLVNLDPAQRLGVFSQPAVIASHSGPTNTRPIKRGVFWVRKVMCMEMEPPPPDVHAKIYEMAGATERQKIESSTAGPACAGCHKIINPFAFFLESYDALGRWRTRDNGAPIDTSILINFLDEEPEKTASTVDALKNFTNSMMFKQCFVRQMFRYYMGRKEEASDDPLLRRMFFEFAHDDRQDILRAVWMLSSSDRIVRRQ